MKKYILLLAAVAATAVAHAQDGAVLPAPEQNEVRHILKLVPQEFIVHTFRVDWELKTGARSSLQISPSFTKVDNSNIGDYDNIIGGGADLTAKFYLQETGATMKGFYGGLNASFHRFGIQDYYAYGPDYNFRNKHTVNRIGGNLVLGYQFLFQGVVALDVYAGGGIRAAQTKGVLYPEYNYSYSFPDPRYQGIAPKIGFSIGMVL